MSKELGPQDPEQPKKNENRPGLLKGIKKAVIKKIDTHTDYNHAAVDHNNSLRERRFDEDLNRTFTPPPARDEENLSPTVGEAFKSWRESFDRRLEEGEARAVEMEKAEKSFKDGSGFNRNWVLDKDITPPSIPLDPDERESYWKGYGAYMEVVFGHGPELTGEPAAWERIGDNTVWFDKKGAIILPQDPDANATEAFEHGEGFDWSQLIREIPGDGKKIIDPDTKD
jgi:hypothetical protein